MELHGGYLDIINRLSKLFFFCSFVLFNECGRRMLKVRNFGSWRLEWVQ